VTSHQLSFVAAAVTALTTLMIASVPAEARNGRNAAFIGGVAAATVGTAVVRSAARTHYYYGGPGYYAAPPAGYYAPQPYYYQKNCPLGAVVC
jgi:hypothetical protein